MPSIKVSDQFGLDIDAQPAPASALLKYFQQLPSLRLDSLDLSKVGGLTLDDAAMQSLSTGVSFQDPVSIGGGAATLTVAAGAHASFRIVKDVDDLPGQDHGDEGPKDICYLCFGVEATVSAGVSAAAGGIQFGATPSTTVKLESYSRFPRKSGVTLMTALQQTVAAFAVPVNSSDLTDLPAGQSTYASVKGKLQLSATANLLATTNPLATVSLPAPLPTATVSAGGSITAGVSLEIDTEYQLIAQKLDSGVVRLGWYHKDQTEVDVHAKASEGISAGFGSGDLFSQVIGAISADPKVDLKELTSAGVPEDQASQIQAAVKAAVCRKLEIAIGAGISATNSEAATFLYEIVPSALTADSRQAIDAALHGDMTTLHGTTFPGISCVRSVVQDVSKRELELDVNLLGILNYRSVTSLSLEGKVLFEPATGSLVITDQATCQRIQSMTVNFGADTQKLRHVLAESFLITAAYHGAGQVGSQPGLRCSHDFFDLQNSTSRTDMACKLRTGFAIGLLSAGEQEPPAGISDFGRTLFSVSTDYDSDVVTGMFLDSGGSPLAHEQYEAAGRAAILFLVHEGDDDAIRRLPALDDKLWNNMKSLGQPGIPSLFPGDPTPLVGAITADYTVIQWWADAMSNTARELATMRRWAAQHPTAGLDDQEFQKLRQDLAKYLRGVAANTRNEFGQPWGLIAMNQLVNRKGGAKILISGPKLVLNKRSEPAAAIGR